MDVADPGRSNAVLQDAQIEVRQGGCNNSIQRSFAAGTNHAPSGPHRKKVSLNTRHKVYQILYGREQPLVERQSRTLAPQRLSGCRATLPPHKRGSGCFPCAVRLSNVPTLETPPNWFLRSTTLSPLVCLQNHFDNAKENQGQTKIVHPQSVRLPAKYQVVNFQ